jgi:hypothetical protein
MVAGMKDRTIIVLIVAAAVAVTVLGLAVGLSIR